MNSTTNLEAKAFKSGMTESYTASATYTIVLPVPTIILNNIPVQNISDSINGQLPINKRLAIVSTNIQSE